MRTLRGPATAVFAALTLLACGSAKEEDLFSGSSTGGGNGTPTPTSFTCGTQTCRAGQLCAIVGAISSCRSIPDACKSTPTCNCAADHLDCKTSFTCSETNGQITWQCQ